MTEQFVLGDKADRLSEDGAQCAARDFIVIIGFTGTPLFANDEITKRVLGDYISRYDFQRAVEDGATVPLYYDARGEKLGVAITDLNERVEELDKELVRAADEQDLIYRQRQIAWMRETEMAVVISEEQGEVDKFRKWNLDIIPHRKLMKEGFLGADGKRIDVEDAFKAEKHPFRIVIVCAMWLTGFDVPSLSTLYLDKPLKAHHRRHARFHHGLGRELSGRVAA